MGIFRPEQSKKIVQNEAMGAVVENLMAGSGSINVHLAYDAPRAYAAFAAQIAATPEWRKDDRED